MSDTFSEFLKRGIGPKTGMQRIPFPTESYEHPSKPLSAKRLLNLYSEAGPKDARSQAALISTPGLGYRETMGAGPIRAFNTDLIGGFYAVSGDHVYRNSAAVTVDLGYVGITDPGPFLASQAGPTIACSQTAAVICVPPNAFLCQHDGPINQITGVFPGASSVTYIDGYFVFTQFDRGTTWFWSIIADGSAYSALDFANLEAHTNIIQRVINHRNELWFAGTAGWEIWYDSGDLDLPFRRRAGGLIPFGISTGLAIGIVDGSVWWLGYDGIVYRSKGYIATRVSTHAIEAIIETETPSEAVASVYTQLGHAFYCLTIGQRTLCYDCATEQWADRSSDLNGVGPWRPLVVGRIGEGVYAGDANGRLYTVDPTSSADDGVQVARQFTMPPVYGGTNRDFMNRIEIEMEVGGANSPGDVLLDWSNDGGNTFRTPRVLNAGTIAQLRKRVFTTQLGSFHERIMRVTVHGKATFYAVDADITAPLAGG